jgi:spore maturation protein CgeB
LDVERDIDVLWMGKRRTRRRSRNIDRIRRELAQHRIKMHVVDGEENPLVYGKERTRLINRSKITLHVMNNWYDNSFHMRFHMVAGNGSMVVGEHIPAHYREYVPGVHYASSKLKNVAEVIRYYLGHEAERREIAENAYELVTTQMTMANSLREILNLADGLGEKKKLW